MGPLHISSTARARHFKFGMRSASRLTTGGTNDNNEKLGQWGSERDLLIYFWKFGTLSLSRERFELQTSNLASRWTTGDANDKNEKIGQRGSRAGHVTYLWNFGSPSISRERCALGTSNLACR